MKRWCAGLASLVLLFTMGCRDQFMHRSDTRAYTLRVPEMASAECLDYLEARLTGHPEYGEDYLSVEADLEQQLVTVTYNALNTGPRNIEHAVADAGFRVESLHPLEPDSNYVIPANPKARADRPAGCR